MEEFFIIALIICCLHKIQYNILMFYYAFVIFWEILKESRVMLGKKMKTFKKNKNTLYKRIIYHRKWLNSIQFKEY